jgi:hypothetical protein
MLDKRADKKRAKKELGRVPELLKTASTRIYLRFPQMQG